MPGVLRSLAGRGVWAGVVAAALAPRAAAQGPELPDDPIAASNRLTALPGPPPEIRLTAAEVPWLVPSADEPPPLPAAPQALAAAPLPPGPPPVPMAVTWSAPPHRPAGLVMRPTPLPTSDRPLLPCEPIAPPTMTPPAAPLPPPKPQPPGDPHAGIPPPPAQPTMRAAADDDPPAKPVSTCRFLDEPVQWKPAAADDGGAILAVVRRGGIATGSAGDIRAAVEKLCRSKAVECQTEVAGERQVRVLLTVSSPADWQRLYNRLQEMPELGEYGLVFQVRVKTEGAKPAAAAK
ncbi:MAG TPA: hypothetical protein VGF55_22390 [Gemmataceae bacterium]|jgi:hypothetical protein